MSQRSRAEHMDVSNTVDVTDATQVGDEVRRIAEACYPDFNFSALDFLVADFRRLYEGSFPGFRACDIKYHDAQHVLDVTLAMARLLDGYERGHSAPDQLGPELMLAGIVGALFHDSGYIRRTRDTRHKNGAAYTRVHVNRSARFLSEYLPQVGLDQMVGVCSRIVHFTGYAQSPNEITVANDGEWRLGALLGTADLIAQMADVDYLRKCRDHLYDEFEIGGMAGEFATSSHTGVVYQSPEHLLESTPNFMRSAIEVRLNGYFGGVHRYAASHFGGSDLYMNAIEENCRQLEAMLAVGAHKSVSSWP
jgi:hypothetical protein